MNELLYISAVVNDKEALTTLLNSEIAVALGILGISITIFTVVYSFVENKLEERKKLKRQMVTSTEIDPYTYAELQFIDKYIERNKKLNKHFIKLTFASVICILVLMLNWILTSAVLFMLGQILTALYFLFFIISVSYYVYRYSKRVERQ